MRPWNKMADIADLLMVVLGGYQLLVAVSLYCGHLGPQTLNLSTQTGRRIFLLGLQSRHRRRTVLLQLLPLPLLTT